MSDPKRKTPLEKAEAMAVKLLAALEPYCSKLEVAGSIRRRRPEVGDIDLVGIPSDRDGLRRRIHGGQGVRVLSEGQKNIAFVLANGMPVQLFLAHEDIPDLLETTPSNWGSLLLCRTGSRAHNLYIARRAQARGLLYSPYRGLVEGQRVVAGRTEEEIYDALTEPYLAPADRENVEW